MTEEYPDNVTVQPAELEPKSNLSPELQNMVRTPEFKAWFGDWENDPENASKIVDENGEPRLVYHGNVSGIQVLHGNARSLTGSDEVGFYFGFNKNTARFYAENKRDPVTDAVLPSSRYSAFLNIKHPYVRQLGDEVNTRRVTEVPTDYDGYINTVSDDEIVVFSPEQIRIIAEEPVNKPQTIGDKAA